MRKSAHIIDLNTADGLAEHMATLPTERLRRLAARPASPWVLAARCELALRDAAS